MNMSKVENLPSLSDKFFMKYTYIYFLKSILMQFGRFSVSGAKRDLSHYFVRHFDVTVGSLARYQNMPVVLISREQSRTNMVKSVQMLVRQFARHRARRVLKLLRCPRTKRLFAKGPKKFETKQMCYS